MFPYLRHRTVLPAGVDWIGRLRKTEVETERERERYVRRERRTACVMGERRVGGGGVRCGW